MKKVGYYFHYVGEADPLRLRKLPEAFALISSVEEPGPNSTLPDEHHFHALPSGIILWEERNQVCCVYCGSLCV